MKVGLFTHNGSPNLGDAIQTIAISRYFVKARAVDRYDSAGREEKDDLLIANGWLGRNKVDINDKNVVFAGVHVHDNPMNYRWMRNSKQVIGARDPFALVGLLKRGIEAKLVGCATLTFDKYSGRRSGVYSVDMRWSDAIQLTHKNKDNYQKQWSLALELLQKYRTAEAVYTSRLHVALPCLAFGTPVYLKHPSKIGKDAIRRFSILDAIGFKYENLDTYDVSYWKNTFEKFLSQRCGTLALSEPKYPE